jgi:hypothetical protein
MQSWLYREGAAVLASCETFRMRSFAAGVGGRSYGVASVYTEPALRGRGHASHMMAALVEELAVRDPAAQAVLLYSDVGEALYARVGFAARPARDRLLAPSVGEPGVAVDRLLDDAAAAAALEAVPCPDAALVLWPTWAQLDWHRERERAYAALLGRPALAAAGACAGEGAIFWAADFKNDKLVVLLLSAARAEAEALVEAACRVAARAQLGEVVCWEPPSGWPEALGTPRARAGSLPMVRALAAPVEGTAYIPRGAWV